MDNLVNLYEIASFLSFRSVKPSLSSLFSYGRWCGSFLRVALRWTLSYVFEPYSRCEFQTNNRIGAVAWRILDIWFVLFYLTISWMCSSSILEPGLLSIHQSWLVRAPCHQTRRVHKNVTPNLFVRLTSRVDFAEYITPEWASFAKNYTLLSTNQKGTVPVDQLANKAIGFELMDKFEKRDFIERLHEECVKNV